MKRLAWAVSGQGRALQAVLEATEAGLLPVSVVAVATDRPSPIAELAEARGVPCRLIPPGAGAYHPDLAALLRETGAEWLGLTFNRLLSEEVLGQMRGRVFNLHLSLLPMFPGFGALRRTLEQGMRMCGVTVHLVDATLDQGPILAQGCAPVARSDSRAALGRRLFETSLPLLLQVVRSIGAGELRFSPETGLDWPRADLPPPGPTPRFPLVDEDLLRFAERYCAALPAG
ncbi:phosphoribosylglycinamide formyltransferase [Rubritepida flocculans]|uniref:phosphoribosylglycinamide formyltransferase n=1 Tax=Rubritepida flocculans TaxID=182403 RepID=UPI0003FF370E|nr:formyltransferase family protein [Rubritepida flocculans]